MVRFNFRRDLRAILFGVSLLAALVACNSGPASATQMGVREAVISPIAPIATPKPLVRGEESAATPTPFSPVADTPVPSPTPIPTLDPVRFAVIGDYGWAGQAEADVAVLVKGWNPDFIITVGDNNYPDGRAETIDENIGQYFHAYIHPYKGGYGEGAETLRFFPSLGNHDWYPTKAQPYFDYFELPGNERYYEFTWGPVHLFALDSDSNEPDGVGSSSIQAQWLKERLAASTAPWKLVYMHHPPYSSGTHGGIAWMVWPFDEWGATAVLSGHDHHYERLLIDGLPYFINGLGGGPIYAIRDPVPGSQLRYNDDYGAMLVAADPGRITFQFINRQGQVVDSYEIVNRRAYVYLPVIQTEQSVSLVP